MNESYAKAMAMTNSVTESLSMTGNHRKAYESSLPEILGLPKDEIQAVNTDVIMAVGRVRVACGRIQGLRAQVVASQKFEPCLTWRTELLFESSPGILEC